TRAWAAAAAVQRPRLTGTTFSSAQRLRVLVDTPERRDASLRVMRSSTAIRRVVSRLGLRQGARPRWQDGAPLPNPLPPPAPIAADAILVGDPVLALLLAQELLEQPKMSNHARGLWGYGGSTLEGRELTIQATGMGGPSAAVVLADLAKLGVRRAVRIGS